MIHLAVATPLGFDSLFFSFIERLAVLNGYSCVNPQSEGMDDKAPGEWVKALSRSPLHHFVVGYRYPPHYWPGLVDEASSVIVLMDGDGITCQVEQIRKMQQEAGQESDLRQSLQGISHAVDAMLRLTERILEEGSPSQMLPPSTAFRQDLGTVFSRLERFYHEAGVEIQASCWQQFSMEAQPFLSNIPPASADLREKIIQCFTSDTATPAQLQALEALFGQRAY